MNLPVGTDAVADTLDVRTEHLRQVPPFENVLDDGVLVHQGLEGLIVCRDSTALGLTLRIQSEGLHGLEELRARSWVELPTQQVRVALEPGRHRHQLHFDVAPQ